MTSPAPLFGTCRVCQRRVRLRIDAQPVRHDGLTLDPDRMMYLPCPGGETPKPRPSAPVSYGRAQCVVCGVDVALRRDGTLRMHGGQYGCPGTGSYPDGAYPADARGAAATTKPEAQNGRADCDLCGALRVARRKDGTLYQHQDTRGSVIAICRPPRAATPRRRNVARKRSLPSTRGELADEIRAMVPADPKTVTQREWLNVAAFIERSGDWEGWEDEWTYSDGA